MGLLCSIGLHKWKGHRCLRCGRADRTKRTLGAGEMCLVIRFFGRDSCDAAFGFLLANRKYRHCEIRVPATGSDHIAYRQRRSTAPGDCVVVVNAPAGHVSDTWHTEEFESLKHAEMPFQDVDYVSYDEIVEVTQPAS